MKLRNIIARFALAFIMLLMLVPEEAEARRKRKKLCNEFDVYLLIGQSNMAGRGYLFPHDKDALNGVFILNDRNEVVPATQPLNRFSTVRKKLSLQAMNIGGSFATDIYKATGRKVLLVVNARSGTSARLWRRGAPPIIAKEKEDDLWYPGEEIPVLYDEAVRRTKIALMYGELKGILFHQGEQDSHEDYYSEWLPKVASIAKSLRHDLADGKKIPFIVGETFQGFKRAHLINPEIQKVSTMIENSDWVSSEGCNSNRDKLHFSRQGVTLMGHRYAEKILQMVYGFSAAAAMVACSGEYLPEYKPLPSDTEGLYTLCDFDSRTVEVGTANADFSVEPNPSPDKCNSSALCGKISLYGGTWDCIRVAHTGPINFMPCSEVRIKVLSPRSDAPVFLKFQPINSKMSEPFMVSTKTNTSVEWEELVFDLSEFKDKSNLFKTFYIMCSGGEKKKETWYVDDILIPDDDISAQSLFKPAGPPMLPDPSKPWMCNSIANPEVLTPEETLDGRWWLLARGGDKVRAHLGYYTQEAETFNPLGPWDYYEGNPVIPAGWHGYADEHHAIDPCGIKIDGTFYYYYKGISKDNESCVLIGTTQDGKNFTPVRTPWKRNCGVADVFKWKDKLYLYVARRIYEYTNPLSGDDALEYEIIQKGGGPANCDWYTINGGKIFRLESIGKWILIYQANVCNTDFPPRFHAAYSDDLINWTKVLNEQPLFTRGPRGAWDQGAIWAPSVFEYNDTLYMYYEGWGVEGEVPNRDQMYFLPGHSQIGIASCKTQDFIEWCGLK